VAFQQMAEVQQGGFIWHRLAAKVDADELAHGQAVIHGPRGSRENLQRIGGGSIAVMCPALMCGVMTAGPDGFRERHPNNAPA
jgi:hypothetical protein